METLKAQLHAGLKDATGDAERCAQAEELIAAVCDVLDRGDATADEVAQAVEASLGAFLVEAERVVAAAESVTRVSP